MPTLLLLPGMDGTGDLFDAFIAALPSAIDVVIVRYPRCEPLGYAELQALARAALPEKGPFVILGESFSGPIAISLAASAPSQLKGLVLCCSFARNPRPRLSALRPLVEVLPIGWAPLRLLGHLCLGRGAAGQPASREGDRRAGGAAFPAPGGAAGSGRGRGPVHAPGDPIRARRSVERGSGNEMNVPHGPAPFRPCMPSAATPIRRGQSARSRSINCPASMGVAPSCPLRMPSARSRLLRCRCTIFSSIEPWVTRR